MTAEWSLPAWVALATLGALLGGLAVVLVLARRAARSARAEAVRLQARVDAIEERLGRPPTPPGTGARATDDVDRVDEREYVITRLGESDDAGAPDAVPVVDAPLFADLVLRESVVQAASFAAGVRRALAPSHLNRVRFEMRREVKRARKQRRADLRQARREYESRQRSAA